MWWSTSGWPCPHERRKWYRTFFTGKLRWNPPRMPRRAWSKICSATEQGCLIERCAIFEILWYRPLSVLQRIFWNGWTIQMITRCSEQSIQHQNPGTILLLWACFCFWKGSSRPITGKAFEIKKSVKRSFFWFLSGNEKEKIDAFYDGAFFDPKDDEKDVKTPMFLRTAYFIYKRMFHFFHACKMEKRMAQCAGLSRVRSENGSHIHFLSVWQIKESWSWRMLPEWN